MAIFALCHVFDLDDVRAVLETSNGAGLIDELTDVFRVAGELFMEAFDDVSGAEEAVLGEIDGAKSAAAEFGTDFVVALDDGAGRPDFANAVRFGGGMHLGLDYQSLIGAKFEFSDDLQLTLPVPYDKNNPPAPCPGRWPRFRP